MEMVLYQFEYDENKSKSNKAKHGIDFLKAQKLFESNGLRFYPAMEVCGENRYLISGNIDTKCFTAIFTIRDGKIRIISVRRCRKKEKERLKDD